MKKISTLLLDFDGTLVDSLWILKSAFYDFLCLNSISHENCKFEDFNGPTLIEIVNIIAQKYKIARSTESLLRIYKNLLFDKYKEANPAEAAVDLLKLFYLRKLPVFIVTSNNRQLVSKWLKIKDLECYITGIISSDDVSRGKPDPALYLEALRVSNSFQGETIAVEDSLHGAQAAFNAGIETYCIKRHVDDKFIKGAVGMEIHWINNLWDLHDILLNRLS